MIETAKERIYREALEEVSRVLPVNSELDLVIGEALIRAKYLPNSTDKLSVEKLQKQLNTAKKALTEIDKSRYGMQFRRNRNPNVARQALAAIGGDDE